MSDYLETITPAVYCRKCPAPTPSVFQDERVEWCSHDHRKGNCRHEECRHYAPCPHQPTKEILK